MSGEKFDNGYIKDYVGHTLGKVDREYIKDQVGHTLGKVDGDYVKDHVGHTLGKVRDYTIRGMEREKDVTIVAAYHFLVKKIF